MFTVLLNGGFSRISFTLLETSIANSVDADMNFICAFGLERISATILIAYHSAVVFPLGRILILPPLLSAVLPRMFVVAPDPLLCLLVAQQLLHILLCQRF